ncbi:hypothetical protein MVEN_02497100 [Mycena venus]|uniref:Uncharacterized protein n=1 Tax=Mycena venus TaxID=2733690 RepID=A0A8H6WXP3_9AGAR|nr:hypothetical protein MVEN_02497100 [Mycena venus]
MKSSLAWVSVLCLSMFVWRVHRPAGYFLKKRESPVAFYAHGNTDSHCELKTAPDFKFCEDSALWDIHDSVTNSSRHEIVVSCDPGRGDWNTVMGPLRNPDPHGALWLLSAEKDAAPRRITFKNYPPNHDFHPLGIAISPSTGNAPSNLFAINHARKRTVIEQFTISPASPGVATHVRTISSSYFVSPNSIALTSPSSFYVSNDHLMTRRLPRTVRWVSHITLDPELTARTPILEHRFAASFIPFANGISLSPSGFQLAVASSTPAEVRLYSRNPTTNALARTHSVPVPFSPDNLDFDETGTLVVSGHPHFPSLVKVKNDPVNAKAPSWVVAVNSTTHNVETLFSERRNILFIIRDRPARRLYGCALREWIVRDWGARLPSIVIVNDTLSYDGIQNSCVYIHSKEYRDFGSLHTSSTK